MTVTTKRGDGGTTDIKDERVAKSSSIIEFLGTIDETIAQLVYAGSLGKKELLEQPVEHLSALAAFTAGYREEFPQSYLQYLDDFISANEVDFGFSYPFESTAKASINCARTAVRKLERRAVNYQKELNLPEVTIQYLNRLSDYLYILQI